MNKTLNQAHHLELKKSILYPNEPAYFKEYFTTLSYVCT